MILNGAWMLSHPPLHHYCSMKWRCWRYWEPHLERMFNTFLAFAALELQDRQSFWDFFWDPLDLACYIWKEDTLFICKGTFERARSPKYVPDFCTSMISRTNPHSLCFAHKPETPSWAADIPWSSIYTCKMSGLSLSYKPYPQSRDHGQWKELNCFLCSTCMINSDLCFLLFLFPYRWTSFSGSKILPLFLFLLQI